MHEVAIYGLDKRHPEREKLYFLPEGWGDLTLKQVEACASILLFPESPVQAKLELFTRLMGLRKQILDEMDVADLLEPVGPEQMPDLGEVNAETGLAEPGTGFKVLSCLDWMFEYSFESSLVAQLHVRHGFSRSSWQGPTNKLGNFIMDQWGFCELLFNQFLDTTESEHLDKLMGALFYPIDEEFHAENIERHALKMARVKDRQKLACAFNYQGLRNYVSSRFPHLFHKKEERTGTNNPPRSYGPNMPELLADLAGPKFGTIDQVKRRNIWDVFPYMNKLAREAQENPS